MKVSTTCTAGGLSDLGQEIKNTKMKYRGPLEDFMKIVSHKKYSQQKCICNFDILLVI